MEISERTGSWPCFHSDSNGGLLAKRLENKQKNFRPKSTTNSESNATLINQIQ